MLPWRLMLRARVPFAVSRDPENGGPTTASAISSARQEFSVVVRSNEATVRWCSDNNMLRAPSASRRLCWSFWRSSARKLRSSCRRRVHSPSHLLNVNGDSIGKNGRTFGLPGDLIRHHLEAASQCAHVHCFDFGVQRHQLVGEGDALESSPRSSSIPVTDRDTSSILDTAIPESCVARSMPSSSDPMVRRDVSMELSTVAVSECPSSSSDDSVTALRACAAMPLKLPQTPTTACSICRLVSSSCVQ